MYLYYWRLVLVMMPDISPGQGGVYRYPKVQEMLHEATTEKCCV